ncbi:MAG: outer membrane lipoprotein-sorting protein [Deltaproteobacteria bacterium]|nr:outer membrane lipoprotein-sorting protein [Deltaproteobacteria bacterium]
MISFRAVCRLALVAISLLLVSGPAFPAGADEAKARELLDRTDDLHRGTSSHGTITMHVKTARYERRLTMEIWSRGEEASLVVIQAPPKEAGTATLMVGEDIWNYLPKVDRTMKVPASMRSGTWMGSHFTNDDLVKESRMADDYTFAITATPETDPQKHWVIECIPKPDAAVVWGRVVVRIRASDELPVQVTYWDEKGALKRTMTFEDVRTIGGRTLPARMRLVPTDKPDEFTEVTYDALEFDVSIPESTFTLQALKR